MQSGGGIATAETMARFPVRMIESGPAAGALMAAAYGKLTGHADLVAFDMGGTTAKLSLIAGGSPQTIREFELHRIRLQPGSGIPMNIQAIDLVEIGAGGGSIARVETGVHRASARTPRAPRPGPICYGLGGTEPTVTDANLVLGYLNPDYFLGRPDAARRRGRPRGASTTDVARPLGLDVAEAAWGIHQVVTTNMELATRVVSIERGYDPRRLALAAFGGSGPVHGCRLAQALGIPRVILPAAAGVTSAIGLLAAEVRFDLSRSYVRRLDALDPAYLARDPRGDGRPGHGGRPGGRRAAATLSVARSADMRYVGQGYELSVPIPDGPVDAGRPPPLRARLRPRLRPPVRLLGPEGGGRARHRGGHRDRRRARRSRLPEQPPGTRDAAEARKPDRPVYFPETRGYVRCADLRPGTRSPVGATIAGPGDRRGARVHDGAASGREGRGRPLGQPDRELEALMAADALERT